MDGFDATGHFLSAAIHALLLRLSNKAAIGMSDVGQKRASNDVASAAAARQLLKVRGVLALDRVSELGKRRELGRRRVLLLRSRSRRRHLLHQRAHMCLCH